jgi:hypothetical protein
MTQSSISGTAHFSGACTLAALGLYVQEIQLFEPIRQQVHIQQKVVKDHPLDKLYDLWVGMLAGLRSVVELDGLLRADPALQRAFGRLRSAEQSVVQQTLDACTPETVEQMRAAVTQIARTYGQAWQPRGEQEWLILDVDLSALTCGKEAEGATKGYFPGRKGRRVGNWGGCMPPRAKKSWPNCSMKARPICVKCSPSSSSKPKPTCSWMSRPGVTP